MTRDYANHRTNKRKSSGNVRRSPTKSSHGGGSKFFPGLVTGLVLGVMLSLFVDFSAIFEDASKKIPEITNKKHEVPSAPRFDFYSLLQDSEKILVDDETPIINERLELGEPSAAPAETATAAKASLSEDIYLLQVGSFKSEGDADSLRVNLLLLNLDAHIEKVKPKPGETWYRVLVGPMDTRAEVSSARDKLASNRIDSLLLKRKR